MIVYLNDQATFVKGDVPVVEVRYQVMRNRSSLEVLQEDFHGRLVLEDTILLIESEMGRMKM